MMLLFIIKYCGYYIALHGIEPRFVDPKSTVLPLYERAVAGGGNSGVFHTPKEADSLDYPPQPFATSPPSCQVRIPNAIYRER